MYICTLPVRQRSVIMTILECKLFSRFFSKEIFHKSKASLLLSKMDLVTCTDVQKTQMITKIMMMT